ncbi:MAG: oxidoreductase [Acidobacteria bacterium SCN 69-37]|nr:MAG: oxidoreductase [Acidobacteria bacterium SCN 69-37]
MTNDATPTPLRVALIGFGAAGMYFHAPFIASTPGLRLAVIVTRNPGRAAQARAEYPGVEILDQAADLWARRDDVDLVVVAAPNVAHVPLATTAIEAGLPVVVDKPLAVTAAQAREVVTLARERGVPLTVFQNRRFDGDFQTLRTLLADGALGVPLRFESRFERWRPVPKSGWRESGAPEDGGGLLMDLGSHLIDQALALFGPVSRVYGELDRRRADVAVDDDVFVALTHTNGVRSHLWMSVLASQLGPRFRLLGDKASYVKFGLDMQEDQLRAGLRPEGASWGEEPVDRWGTFGTGDDARQVATAQGHYGRFYAGVAAALRDGGPMPVDPEDACRTLEIIEAARQSAIEQRVVTLAWRSRPAE